MEERSKLLWWGYKHISGNYQVKRYFGKLDIIEAQQSPFCGAIAGPFEANGRDEALKILEERIKR